MRDALGSPEFWNSFVESRLIDGRLIDGREVRLNEQALIVTRQTNQRFANRLS